MTEAEWLKSTDPKPLLEFLRGKASDRQLRLSVFACVRRLWDLVPTEPLRRAIETSERHADGLADDRELGSSVTNANRARPKGSGLARAAYDAARYSPSDGVHWDSVTMHMARAAASSAVRNVPPSAYSYFEGEKLITVEIPMNPSRQAWNARHDAEYSSQCDLIRDIIGNPFCSVITDTSLLSPSVVSLAETIDNERAFDRMPELADALEATGGKNKDILEHCRGPGPHVRGCWVVDLLLGKR